MAAENVVNLIVGAYVKTFKSQHAIASNFSMPGAILYFDMVCTGFHKISKQI